MVSKWTGLKCCKAILDQFHLYKEEKNMNLEGIMHNSTYEVLPGTYSVAKINSDFKCNEIFMVTRDSLECTAIYRTGTAYEGIIEEKKNYKLIAINVALPFYAPGFIATISHQLAQKSISVLVVSTYSRDYFIISTINLDDSIDEMKKLGMKTAKDNVNE